MATERSDQLGHNAQAAALKFDYFMAGVCTALVSYLAPTFDPAPFGWNAATLQVLSFTLLLFAAFAAFKRIHVVVHLMKLNAAMLYHGEMTGTYVQASTSSGLLVNKGTGQVLSPGDAGELAAVHSELSEKTRELLNRVADKTEIWSRLRSAALYLGLVLLIASRIWIAYAR